MKHLGDLEGFHGGLAKPLHEGGLTKPLGALAGLHESPMGFMVLCKH